ncbi:MAG: carbonic anhydrase [Phycisphaerales bacterium]|nr:carbonic anhydrase [Phycisphaerales bacterium]
MRKLVEGVLRYQRDVHAEHGELFESLAKGQRPHTLFVTCSDSRIHPSLVTSTKPGELFVMRNAGAIIPPYGAASGGESATIEFAVEGLGVQDIVVCGHSHCGAMQGLLNREALKRFKEMDAWLRFGEAAIRATAAWVDTLSPEELLNAVIQRSALAQLDHLRTHPSVAAAIDEGRVRLHAWEYRFESGDVLAYDPSCGRFRPIAELADSYQDALATAKRD